MAAYEGNSPQRGVRYSVRNLEGQTFRTGRTIKLTILYKLRKEICTTGELWALNGIQKSKAEG